MQLSRKITGEFIAVFLIGTVVGGLVEWDYTGEQLLQLMDSTKNPEVLVARENEKYAEQYHFSPEELQRITELSQFMTRTNDPDILVARANKKYAETYHFSAEELQRIQPLIKEMAQHISQVRHQFGSDILSTLEEYHKKIADQLTPEHRIVYEKANDERKKQISSMLMLDQNAANQGQK